MKKYILILLVSIFAMSCSSKDDNSENLKVHSTLIAKDNLYGNGEEGILKQKLEITDQNTWEALITQMNSVNNVSDSFLETDIDFSEYRIIAIFDEVRPSDGYSLDINIISTSETIMVQVTDVVPQGNTPSVMTQPFHIVKILNSNLPIIFE